MYTKSLGYTILTLSYLEEITHRFMVSGHKSNEKGKYCTAKTVGNLKNISI